MGGIRLYRAAVVIHAISSLYGILASLPTLMQGPDAQTITQGVPQVVIVLAVLLNVAGLVSAYGAWHLQRWGIGLTLVVEALNGMLALPGVLFAPSEFTRVSALAGVLVSVFVVYAMLRLPWGMNVTAGGG